MRVMPFVQVLLLLVLAGYLLLVALENPQPVRLPLPFGRGEWLTGTGAAMGMFVVVGGAFVALLLLPLLWRQGARRRRERRERRALEGRLTATLQARLGALPVAAPESSPAPTRNEPAVTETA
ncbi:hypothetical protein [Deinococcus sp. Leaf326]|uniref:hypothetical protein n=1 Tax=Deinococcus sp. Leaf326 TaxID=1736338 RepID=UPI0006F9CA53|nr:hypothetical protein [Deinococcus sp. Leaf326]KQQ99414.1 hypothetical protein ASF71_13650 [Deinococcus sp. Leaf326]